MTFHFRIVDMNIGYGHLYFLTKVALTALDDIIVEMLLLVQRESSLKNPT